MFKFVRLNDAQGNQIAVFTGCSETGYSAKDVITMPGVYEECLSANGGTVMKMVPLGVGDIIKTPGYALAITEISPDMQDLTSVVSRIYGLPSTAANSLLQTMSSDLHEDITQAVESLKFYETVTSSSKVCLPAEVLVDIDPQVAQSMQSARQTYVLKATENQEIFQKTADSEFCVRLPSLDDIHSDSGFRFSNLDILRVTMPYRRPGTPTMYEPIYHTPYFKVGQYLGMVPPYLQWIDGYSSNDLLDIQPNERHMQRNLYTLYQSDISRYVAEMVTGVFFGTNFGAKLNKLRLLNELEVIQHLVSEIRTDTASVSDGVAAHCSLSDEDIQELWDRGWNPTEVGRRIKERLTFDEGFLEAVVRAQHPARRVVVTKNHIMTIALTDAQEQLFTDLFIQMGFMSHELHDFFLKLCQRAYEVNWGHTGSAQAVTPLVGETDIPAVAKEFTQYLNTREVGKAPTPQEYMTLYRGTYSDPTVVDDDSSINAFIVGDDDDSQSDFIAIGYNHYVTRTTAARMMNGDVDFSALQEEHEGLDNETRVIERWRIVNGNSNLVYFLTDAYMRTADAKIYIQAFIKLLRWGERRPKVLALQDHPEIRKVFDICNGNEGDNTTIVDESELVKVNGCDYSLAGFLNSTSNNDINPSHILGFILEKNYGTVVKQYLASWEDLAEMVSACDINIGEFKVMARVDISPGGFIPIESFEKKSYEVYESDKSIQDGLKWKVRGSEMSCLFLLPHPQITAERSYIRSATNETIMLPIDKKYDNLRRYIDNLRRFYRNYGDRIAAVKTTVDLQDLASLFAEIVKNGAAEKKDQNSSAAASALSRMSLDLGGSCEIEYDTSELKGKFVLVNDGNNLTDKDDTWEAIPFSNQQLQKIASRPKTSIVLLLLKTPNCWLLCRKDISPAEVDVVLRDGARKINSESYTRLKPQVDELLQGRPATYSGMPLKLHISAKLER